MINISFSGIIRYIGTPPSGNKWIIDRFETYEMAVRNLSEIIFYSHRRHRLYLVSRINNFIRSDDFFIVIRQFPRDILSKFNFCFPVVSKGFILTLFSNLYPLLLSPYTSDMSINVWFSNDKEHLSQHFLIHVYNNIYYIW